MSQGIYITGAEPGSGKSLVVLGLMEMLSARGRKIGIFRPVINAEPDQDYILHLVTRRYHTDIPSRSLFGCTSETMRELLSSDRHEELIEMVLSKYRSLEQECDMVVSVGTDYAGGSAALEFDFNTAVANNLGSLVVLVVKGQGKNARQMLDAALSLLESLEQRKCDILALIANRVPPSEAEALSLGFRAAVPDSVPFYVVPEVAMLSKPTVGEVAKALSAEYIRGEQGSFNREIGNYKIAAMELPHFLDYLENGTLVITPGDRSDIILGSLIADASHAYGQIAGLLLTGGLKPAPQLQKLIEGIVALPVPILSVPTDTFTTATAVSALEAALMPENERKIAAALGAMEAHVDPRSIEERLRVVHSSRTTPLMFEYDLIQRAKAKRQHIVLPEGTEERILKAAEIVIMRGVADVTLLGNENEVRQKITSLGLRLDGVHIIDPITSEKRRIYAGTYYGLRKQKGISEQMAYDTVGDVSYFGTMMVYNSEADAMVSGSVHTTQHTIRPALEVIRTRPGCSLVSSVFFMCLSDRVLVFGDCAVNPDPDSRQLADIAISSAETAVMFGIEPRVAMLSYSTGESGKGAEVDKVREATETARRLRPDLKIEGPIQYDAAIDPDVAKVKMPRSEVAGRATIFIFPDLNTGNNTYKAVQRAANAVAIGPILQGLNKPVNDLSRGCTVADIINTIAITAIQAQGPEKKP